MKAGLKQWPSVGCQLRRWGAWRGAVLHPLRLQGPRHRFSPSRLERERRCRPCALTEAASVLASLSRAPQCQQSKKGRTRPTPTTTAPRYQGCIRSARLITHRDRTKGKSAVAPPLFLCVCCVHAFRPRSRLRLFCFAKRFLSLRLVSLAAREFVCVTAFWGISVD